MQILDGGLVAALLLAGFFAHTLPFWGVLAVTYAPYVAVFCVLRFWELDLAISLAVRDRLLSSAVVTAVCGALAASLVYFPANRLLLSVTGVPASATPEAATAFYAVGAMVVVVVVALVVVACTSVYSAFACMWHYANLSTEPMLRERVEELLPDDAQRLLGSADQTARALKFAAHVLNAVQTVFAFYALAFTVSVLLERAEMPSLASVRASVAHLSFHKGAACEGLKEKEVAFLSDQRVAVAERLPGGDVRFTLQECKVADTK